LDQYIFFGGYPGAAPIINDQLRWSNYICDALIETTIARDILLMTTIKKPTLLRNLFKLGCEYSGQILSYQKMLGQLQEDGNTTTLAHYLQLLQNVGMLAGIQKFSPSRVERRASSPKLQVLNTALISAQVNILFETAKENSRFLGTTCRIVHRRSPVQ
jgi:predicted AAA+ superfamily ATPase